MVEYLGLGAGITPDEIRRVMIQYPSTAAVKQHKMSNGNLGVIQVSMIGVSSSGNSSPVTYQVLLDFRGFPSSTPQAFIRSPRSSEIRHCNIHKSSRYPIAPNIDLCAICIGRYASDFDSLPEERLMRLGCYLNQIQYILSNPNPNSKAR
jgi:hypothetical protein